MISISVSGTHSVGKTTLVNRLQESIKEINVKLIPEIARILINKGFKLNQDITEYGIINYVTEYLFHERETQSDVVISDRSLIDLLAYIKTNNSSKIRSKYINLVEEVVFEESKRFNFYIYIPIEFNLVIDNVRPADISYQKEVDKTIRNLFEFFNINVHTIKGSVEQRVKKVLDLINGQYK